MMMAMHPEERNKDAPWNRKQCFKATTRLSSVLRLFLRPLASATLIEKLFTSALTCMFPHLYFPCYSLNTRMLLVKFNLIC